MIPNTPNRYGEVGVWITTVEWVRTVAALRGLGWEVERALRLAGADAGVDRSTVGVRQAVDQARGALWVLTGEEVGRRKSAPSGDRS